MVDASEYSLRLAGADVDLWSTNTNQRRGEAQIIACNASEAPDEGFSLPEATGKDSAHHAMMTYTLTFTFVQAPCFEQKNEIATGSRRRNKKEIYIENYLWMEKRMV